jgi:RNA recognition motif-containing protein
MADDEAAKKAISELDGASVDGRTINVSIAKPREERTGGTGGGNRSGGGGNFQKRNNFTNSRY